MTTRTGAAVILFAVFMYFLGVGVGISSQKETYDINVPTCAELNEVGYDGLATCLDANGNYQTPGR